MREMVYHVGTPAFSGLGCCSCCEPLSTTVRHHRAQTHRRRTLIMSFVSSSIVNPPAIITHPSTSEIDRILKHPPAFSLCRLYQGEPQAPNHRHQTKLQHPDSLQSFNDGLPPHTCCASAPFVRSPLAQSHVYDGTLNEFKRDLLLGCHVELNTVVLGYTALSILNRIGLLLNQQRLLHQRAAQSDVWRRGPIGCLVHQLRCIKSKERIELAPRNKTHRASWN